MDAYYLSSLLFSPGNPQLTEGLLKNLLHTQTEEWVC